MSGASLGVLSLAVPQIARAVTINSSVPGYVVANTVIVDRVLVTSGGDVAGDLTNDGLIGIPSGQHAGIEVSGTGLVEGTIFNDNLVVVDTTGVADGILIAGSGAVNGSIVNTANADIVVALTNPNQYHAAAGIAVENGALGGYIDNSGEIYVGGIGASGSSRAAEYDGINLDLTDGNLLIDNMGVIDAHAFASTDNANLRVDGVDVVDSGHIAVAFDNQGTVSARAVYAAASGANAYATGIKIYNMSNAFTSSGPDEYARVNNWNKIDVIAKASATDGDAQAHAEGVYLGVEGHDYNTATAVVRNYASGVIDASAVASAYNSAGANARGVELYAEYASFITAAVDNTGLIKAVARAHGPTSTAASTAVANATGVKEYAQYATSGRLVVDNSGTIDATAAATASYVAHANAYGIKQTGEHVDYAVNTVANWGHIAASAKAVANGGFTTTATAHAKAVGIDQALTHVSSAENFVGNYKTESGEAAGVIMAKAVASATYTAGAAATGINQQITSAFYARNAVANSGAIEAVATATATSAAHAVAVGINQKISSATTAYNDVTNRGSIAALASAAALGDAGASAVGVNQKIVNASSAYNFVSNNASAAIEAVAAAGAFSSAGAKAAGVYQEVSNAGYADNDVVNGGVIMAVADALALGSAAAKAAGIKQGITNASTALDVVVNHGTVMAVASAMASVSANATAVGIDQKILYATDAHNRVTNYGTIEANAIAGAALGTSNAATASAVGVKQFITAHASAPAAVASNEIVNNDSIRAAAHVGAVGTTSASPVAGAHSANATAMGARQIVANFDAGTNDVYNDGVIAAVATAVAGEAGAPSAYAHALGVDQLANLGETADNYVANNESIEATARATAIGGKGAATATGVYQQAAILHSHTIVTSSSSAIVTVPGAAVNNVYNDGWLTAHAYVDARSGELGLPLDKAAYAHAIGVGQYVGMATSGIDEVTNDYRIVAYAGAVATGKATASADGVLQAQAMIHHASNEVRNFDFIAATALAEQSALSGTAGVARATAYGVDQEIHDAVHGYNGVYNAGEIIADAAAYASFEADARAVGIEQMIGSTHGYVPTAENYVYNTAHASVRAYANAAGSTKAQASAGGVVQAAFGSEGASADNYVYNLGRIYANADASDAHANAVGVEQVAMASTAFNYVSNQGYITAKAEAYGLLDNAQGYGVMQEAYGYTAVNEVINHGQIVASALAGSSAAIEARAQAAGIEQAAMGFSSALNMAVNDGVIHANAHAVAQTSAKATGVGIYQGAVAGGIAKNVASLTAHGVIVAHGTAVASRTTGSAAVVKATAEAGGILQIAAGGGSVTQAAVNAGAVRAYANAIAFGASASAAKAKAEAVGIMQGYSGVDVYDTVTNHGNITAEAFAEAYGATSTVRADAFAAGIDVGKGGPVLAAAADVAHVDVVNDGHIYASAVAVGVTASARAYGIRVENTDVATSAGLVVGAVENLAAGHITAEARATNAFTGYAHAVGIGVTGAEFSGTVENLGYIDAQAFASTAQATGIRIAGNGATVTGVLPVALVVNDGGYIYASENDGEIGNAINVEPAPNEVDIELRGTTRMGRIFGNIENAESTSNWVNKVTVSNGVTYFDGSVNPELPTGSLAEGGTFSISANGTLWLPNAVSSYWGANPDLRVASYTQAGALKLDVDGSANVATIHATAATLTGGSVVVNPNAFSLYPNTQTYQVVFAPRGGTTWSGVTTTTGSPLLTFAAAYPSANEADIVLTRVAFDAVSGLTPIEKTVAGGLENAYSITATGEGKLFYESLFQLNAAAYPGVLDTLSGVEAGEMAEADLGAARDLGNAIGARLDAISAVAATGGNGTSIWGEFVGGQDNVSTTLSGPGYHVRHNAVVLGVDTLLSDNHVVVGAAGSITFAANVPFKSGNGGKLSGYQVGGYARYNAAVEDGGYYLQGNVSYGNYDNTTRRFVSLPLFGGAQATMAGPGSPPAATMPPYDVPATGSGWLSGSFSDGVWNVYGEGGYPFVTGNVKFTPYVGLQYMDASSDAYAETGTVGGHTAPLLHVTEASATSLSSYLGVQLATTWTVSDSSTFEAVLPSLRVAWAHEFDGDQWNLHAYFDGLGPTSAFQLDGSRLAKDSAAIDANIAVEISGNLMATIGYSGRLNDTTTSNALFGRLDIRF
jgi:trimeric autotransporter adhesin